MGCGTSKVLPVDPSAPPTPKLAAAADGSRRPGPTPEPAETIDNTAEKVAQPAPRPATAPSAETGTATGASAITTAKAAGPIQLPGSAQSDQATSLPPADGPANANAADGNGAVSLNPADAAANDAATDGTGAAAPPAAAATTLDSSTITTEAETAPTPTIILDDEPLAVVSKGISLRGLRKLRQRLIAYFGSEAAYAELTTEDVNTRWVQEVTRGSCCRVAEDPSLIASEDVGVPQYFISHAWKNRFELLLSSVEVFLTSADEETRVWIDILAVNQHRGMPHQARDVAAFKDVVRASSSGTLVVLDLAKINPARRAWCIYEWAATLALHGPEGLHMRVEPEGRAQLVSSLDVNQAECYNPPDKEMILADVVAQHGSTDAFNSKLRLQLLLEPLSYSVDVRRLAERAEGTSWRFGPVDEWLDAGARRKWEGGRRGDDVPTAEVEGELPLQRTLVVAGGAGEGKSTVSAVLVGGSSGSSSGSQGTWGVKPASSAGEGGAAADAVAAGGGGGGGAVGCVDAFHFLKYNDQRRLDPVRIVKSLAFQLAGRIPELAKALLGGRIQQIITPRNAYDAYDTLLEEPLKGLTEPRQVVILIDALDEAEPPPPPPPPAAADAAAAVTALPPGSIPCGNKAFQLISKQLARLPPFVRFIFTTRPDALGGTVLPALERLFTEQGGMRLLRPGELREPGDGGGGGDDGGVMVYHTVASKCLQAAAAMPAVGSMSRPSLADLYGLYGTVFSRAWTSYDAREAGAVRALLEAVLAAQEPLPQSRLQALGLSRAPTKLPGWPVLFSVEEHHLYTLHKSLADWLTESDGSGGSGGAGGGGGGGGGVARPFMAVATANGHLQLARQLASERSAAVTTHGSAAAAAKTAAAVGGAVSAISPYCFKYLVRHLVMASASAPPGSAVLEEAHELLIDVLYDFGFMAGAFREGHGYGLIEDLAAMRDPPPAVSDALRWLLAKQHELKQVREAGQLLPSALLCPSGTAAARRAAEYLTSMQWQAGRPGYRLLQQIRGPDVSWPTLKSTLKGYKYAFTGVAFSPDGRVVANTSKAKEGFVRVWDARSGAELTIIEPKHSAEFQETYDLTSIAFSPDGRTMMCGSSVSRIFMYDVMTGDETGVIAAHKWNISSVAFMELDGEAVLVSGGNDQTVQIWRHRPDSPAAAAAAAAAAATTAAAAAEGVQPWRRPVVSRGQGLDWQCIAVLKQEGKHNYVNGLAVGRGADGPMIVTASNDGVVRVWERRQQPDGDGDGGGGGGDSGGHVGGGGGGGGGEGDAVSAGGWSCTARLVKDKPDYVLGVALSSDGMTIISTFKKNVRMWKRRALTAAGAEVGGASDTSADVTAAWECVSSLKGHLGSVNRVMFFTLHDLTILASCGGFGDDTVRLWVQSRGGLEGGQSAAAAVKVSAPSAGGGRGDDDTGDDDVDDGGWQTAVVLKGHNRSVLDLAVSPTNPLNLASSSEDGTVVLWELRSKERQDLKDAAAGRLVVVEGPTGDRYIYVVAVALSHDHEWLAAASSGEDLRLWRRAPDGSGWREAAVLKDHGNDVHCVAFSRPDSKGRLWMASGGADRNVRLWLHGAAAGVGSGADAAGGWSCVHVFEPPPPVGRQELYAVYSLCFGGGGTATATTTTGGGGGVHPLILAASGLGTLRVWTPAEDDSSRWESSTVQPASAGQESGLVEHVVARQDGRLVAGATRDGGSVQMWTHVSAVPRSAAATAAESASGACWQLTWTVWTDHKDLRFLALSPDGRSLATAGDDRKECCMWYLVGDDADDDGGGGGDDYGFGGGDGYGSCGAQEEASEDSSVEESQDSSCDNAGPTQQGDGPAGGAPVRRRIRRRWAPAGKLDHESPIWCLSYSADGRTLVTSSGSSRREEKLVRLFRLAPPHPAAVAMVASVGLPGVWAPVLELRGHTEAITALSFSPTDPEVLATGSADTGVRLWQLLEPGSSEGGGSKGSGQP